ncbi:MAG: 8-amino-7-oxononanoate synthase [Pantoea sp. Brub]|nr:8-amino-7-oxononanoate synthase [Pantoea sp. Brub]
MNWINRINRALYTKQFNNHWRYRYIVGNNNTRFIKIGNKIYRNFSSNDYLGLSRHPSVIDAWKYGARLMGAGTSSSSYIIGFHYLHMELELQLADWLGYPRALLFNSGFAANQAIIYLLCKKNDRIIADKLVHASIIDASIHSSSKLYRFDHNSIDQLCIYLNKPCNGETLVITEGIFSMDGDSAPLKDIAKHTQTSHSWLLVDDAHGIGVIGHEGKGSCFYHGIKPELLMITFGKAFGISGAAVLCNNLIADYFLQFSQHLIYSTSMPPAQIYALQIALKLVQKSNDLRQRLQKNIDYFLLGIKNIPCQLMNSQSAIQPIIIGNTKYATDVCKKLANAGCWVNVIRPPTVPIGTTRLRINLSALHEYEDIDILLEALHYATNK